MLAGSLEIQLMADMSRLNADMQKAQQVTGAAMGNISASMNQAKATIDAMAAAEKARASLFDRTMTESKRLLDVLKGGATQTRQALADLKINPDALKIPKEAFDSLKSWQDKAAFVFGAGAAAAAVGAQKVWEEFKSTTERTLVIWGVAAATGIAAVVLSAVYAAYKSASFVIGLFTGESYKSASIDALVKQTDDLKASQDALALTLSNSKSAIGANQDALDAMGVSYKDGDGKLLATTETLQNAVDELDKYTEGSARAAAANALGLGSYEEITKALKKVDDQSAESRQRLNDYNLGIGTESAAAVDAYKSAMKDFNDESQKTSDGFKRAWADQIMPILTDFAVFLKDGFPTLVNGFRNSMALITSAFYGFKTIMFGIYDSIMGVLQAAGNGLAGLAAAAAAAAQGNFAGAKEALLSSWADAKDRFAGIGTSISDRAVKDANAVKLAWAMDDRAAGLPMKAVTEGLSGATAQALKLASSLNSNKGALSSLQQDYVKLNAAMDDLAAHGQKGSDQYKVLESALMKVGKQIGDVASATKTATAATDPQIKAYADLIVSITAKTQANTQEAAAGRKLTEAETQALEIRKMVEKGTISLTQAESALTKEKIKALEVAEMAKLVQQSEFKQAQDTATARQKLTQDGYDEATKLYESEVTLNRDRLKSGKETLEQIQFDTVALTLNTQQREIAVAMRALEKNGIKEGTEAWTTYGEAVRAAVTKKSELEKSVTDFKSIWESVDKTAHDTFTNIFQGGKNAFTKLRDTLKSTLLDLLYQMTVKKWVFNITAAVTGTSAGIANAATGGGGALGVASNLSSLNTLYGAGTQLLTGSVAGASTASLAGANAVGALGGDAIGTLATLNGGWAGVTTAVTANTAALGVAADALLPLAAIDVSTGLAVTGAAAGGLTGGITAALGAIGPAGWAAIAAIAAFSIFGGKKESASASTGSLYRDYDATGAITAERSPFAKGNADVVVDGLFTRLTDLQKLLGATATATTLSYNAYSGTGNKDPKFQITGGNFASGEVAKTDENLQLAAERAILSALQASELPKGIATILNKVTAGTATLEQIKEAETAAAAYSASIKALNSAFDSLPFGNLKGLAFDAADALVAASGGLEKLSGNLTSYIENFYSAEDQRAQKVKDITRTLNTAGVGVTTDEIGAMTREQYRALVESITSVSEANAPAVAALYATAGAFAQITPAVESVNRAYARLTDTTKTSEQQAQTRIGLEDQLLQLNGTADQLRAKAIAGMDAYNVKLYDGVQTATKAAAQAQTRIGLEDQLLQLTGTADQLRAKAIAGMDAYNVSLYDSVQTATKAAKDTQEADAAAAAQLQTKLGLERQILTLNGDTAALRLLDIKGMDAANITLHDRVQSMTAEKTANDALKASLDSFANTAEKLQIDLLNAQGKTADASVALRALETRGYTAAQTAAYDYNKAILTQIDTFKSASAAAAKIAADTPGVIAKFRTPEENTNQKYADIAQNLYKSGVTGLGDAGKLAEVLKSSSKEAIYVGLRDVFNGADTNDVTKQALLDAGSALADLKDAAIAVVPAVTAVVEAVVAIESLAEAYARLSNVTKTNEQQAQARISLEDQLLQINGTADQLRLKAIAGLDAFNIALYDQVQAATKARDATAAAAAAALALATTNKGVQDQIDVLKGTQTTRSIALRDALDDSTRALLQTVYSLEDLKTAAEAAKAATEKNAAAINTLVEAGKNLQVEMLRAQGQPKAADDLQRAFDTIDFSPLAITLYDANKASQALITSLNAQAEKAKAVASERDGLQNQLYAATDTAAEAAIRAKSAIDPLNLTLYDLVKAAEKAKEIESEKKGLQDQINALTDTAAEALIRQRDALDKSNRALFDSVQLATKAKQIAEERNGLQTQLNALTDTAAEALIRQKDALDKSNQALFDQIQLATSAKAAADERKGLQDQLNASTDTAAQALTRQRDALFASNRALFDQIQAVNAAKKVQEDSKVATTDAMAGVQRAIDAEKKRISVIQQAAQESVNSIKGVFTLLRDQAEQLYSTVDSTKAMQEAQGNAFIDNALSNAQTTGYLPDQEALAKAISAARSGLDSNNFTTQFEADKAALVMAGKLSKISDIAGPQLSAAEQSLKIANDQLAALDRQLETARQQVDAVNNVNDSVVSVAQALKDLTTALSVQKSLTGAGGAAAVASAGTAGGSSLFDLVKKAVPSALPYDIVTGPGGANAQEAVLKGYKESLLSSVVPAFASSGFSSDKVSELYGIDKKDVLAYAAAKGFPAFAGGGMFGGGLRIVGENGPELEATGPSRIYNASETRSMMGGNTDRLERLVEGLTAEVQRLQGVVAIGNQNTRRTADAVNGNADVPMLVQTV